MHSNSAGFPVSWHFNMLAVTFQKPFEVAVSTVDKPSLQEPTDAIVKVSLAGLCGKPSL
jgi:threonine dehydrogenase-like Zn-dependent dehydrogenase